jgi:hypothetical protein
MQKFSVLNSYSSVLNFFFFTGESLCVSVAHKPARRGKKEGGGSPLLLLLRVLYRTLPLK